MKRLSKNEQQVLNLMAEGFKNKEIAQIMKSRKGESLSEKTISEYSQRIRRKLKIPADKNQYFLVTEAKNLNLV